MNFKKPEAVRICPATSTVCPAMTGTAAVCGPLPTTTVISLVIADVWFAGGIVERTLSFCSGVEADSVCLYLPNPAALSFWTHSP
jgi:hypothetical protein